MGNIKKAAIAAIPFTVLLCFTYGHLQHTRATSAADAKREHTIQKITQHIEDEGVTFDDEELRTIAEILYEQSKKHHVDYRLVLAIMKVESNFKGDAVSRQGARGLLQVKPSLAKFIAEDVGIKWHGAKTLDEPAKNITIGIHHFSALVEDFESVNLALHAYHVGPTRLREILLSKHRLNKCFLNLVLAEYEKNTSTLPAP